MLDIQGYRTSMFFPYLPVFTTGNSLARPSVRTTTYASIERTCIIFCAEAPLVTLKHEGSWRFWFSLLSDRTGSGFKINVQNLSNLTLNLGPYKSNPVLMGFNAAQGVNVVPFGGLFSASDVYGRRANTFCWASTESGHLSTSEVNIAFRLDLESPFQPVYIALIHTDQCTRAWCLVLLGINFYGNIHENSSQFFQVQPFPLSPLSYSYDLAVVPKTENTMCYANLRKRTDPLRTSSETTPLPPSVFQSRSLLSLPCNVAANNDADFDAAPTPGKYPHYLPCAAPIYHSAGIDLVLLNPRGWPNPEGHPWLYYAGIRQQVVNHWQGLGDKNVYLVNATRWINHNHVYPSWTFHFISQILLRVTRKWCFESSLEEWGMVTEGR
ncbi:hypothetical protein F4604DRAFT_1689031 [Suillus subluteus]|nr:hypothetical protein F4604DRAFT_1689031 [Suillus subluteus]